MGKDSELYLQYLAGDEAALGELIRLYKDGLIFYLDSFLHDIHTAEDLTEETFIKIAIRRPRYVPRGQFQAWLYKIARNLAISHLRKVSRVKALPLETVGELPDDALSLEQSYLLQERRIAVRRALRKINPDYAQVLYLTYFAGFDNGHPVFGRTFTGTHSGFSRFFGNRLIRENLNPNLTATLDVTRHSDTGGFDLVGRNPSGFKRHKTVITVSDLCTSGSLTGQTTSVDSAVFHSLRQ